MKGDLFLTQEYLCFLGISRIAIEKKIKYAYEDISKIEINDEKSLSIYEQDEYKCSFTFYDDITEVHTYMIRQWNMIKEKEQNESTIRLKKQNIDENKVGKLFPSRKRTQTLIDYSKHVTYNKGDLIVDQGITLQPAIYFLTEGSIEVDKDFGDGKHVFFEILKSPASFLHTTYLMKGAPIQFRIRANEEGTTVSIVDGYYLDCIFHHNKNLASKYFHLISQQLSTNITSRERSLYEAKVGFTMSSKKHSSSKIDTSLDDTETYLKKRRIK